SLEGVKSSPRADSAPSDVTSGPGSPAGGTSVGWVRPAGSEGGAVETAGGRFFPPQPAASAAATASTSQARLRRQVIEPPSFVDPHGPQSGCSFLPGPAGSMVIV